MRGFVADSMLVILVRSGTHNKGTTFHTLHLERHLTHLKNRGFERVRHNCFLRVHLCGQKHRGKKEYR